MAKIKAVELQPGTVFWYPVIGGDALAQAERTREGDLCELLPEWAERWARSMPRIVIDVRFRLPCKVEGTRAIVHNWTIYAKPDDEFRLKD